MKTYCLIAILATLAAWVCVEAAVREIPTVELGVSIEVIKPDKVCAKAVKVLGSSRTPEPMSEADARAFMSIDGQLSTAKCLEVIFSELSSPTNGYRVHEVSSRPGTASVVAGG